MALSYYSNWGDSIQQQQQMMDNADDPELQALLHGADSLFNPNDSFFSDQNCNNSLIYGDFANGVPHQDVEFQTFQHPPKLQKRCDFDSDQIYSSLFPPNPCLNTLQDYPPPPPPPFLDFPAAGYYAYSSGSGSMESTRKEATGSLSTQSAAARQRRRRITEKTQELGKLVPGGQKMNTAEMLQSAYKYIKFLQAQVALLEFVGLSNQEVAEAPDEGEELLQILLESPLIQEKLYSTEHCLAPRKFVDEKAVQSMQ